MGRQSCHHGWVLINHYSVKNGFLPIVNNKLNIVKIILLKFTLKLLRILVTCLNCNKLCAVVHDGLTDLEVMKFARNIKIKRLKTIYNEIIFCCKYSLNYDLSDIFPLNVSTKCIVPGRNTENSYIYRIKTFLFRN